MQTPWKLVTGSALALVLGATAFAYGAESVSLTLFGASAAPAGVHRTMADICPPMACTIVLKTERGGPPSAVYSVN